MRLKPLPGKALLKILGPIPPSSIIEAPDRHVPPEEQMVLNHKPTPPEPQRAEVLELGAWKQLANGLSVVPPFTVGTVVLIRDGAGQQLRYGTSEKLRMVDTKDVLAVLS